MSPLITLQNLSLHYPHKVLFKNTSLTIHLKDKIGVLGLNGHGKSSLFKIIAGLVEPDKTIPAFIFDKSQDFSYLHIPQELAHVSLYSVEDYFYEFYPDFKALKKELDLINEKFSSQTENFESLIHQQEYVLERLNTLDVPKIHAQYISYLKYFGVKDFHRKMESLSGGEQRKVALSLGLSAPQELILWDEPTNHLDLETIKLFEEEVQNLNKTILMISHDRSLLNNVVDKIIHIQHGKIDVFNGTYEAYLHFLQEEEKRREKELDRLSNMKRRETAWIQRGVQARRTKSKKRIESYGQLNEQIAALKAKAHSTVDLQLKSSGRKTKKLLSVENLSLSYDENKLFHHLDFSIFKGDKIALLGPNGVGKSSLLKLLTGENHHGTFEGDIYRAPELDIGYFSQKRESLNPELTPWELIGEGIDFVISNSGEKKHVASYLENFLFTPEEIKRPIHTFSGGEKNRLQLAQFMKHARDIWIFDEPTNDLDLETIGILEDELKKYEGAVIIVGHDRVFIENTTTKCFVLHNAGLDIFEGGFSQAEYFLDAIALEKQVQLKKNVSSTSNPQLEKNHIIQPAPKKLSNKEKKRLEQLPEIIENEEEKLNLLKEEMSSFDYSSMGQDSLEKMTKLQKEIEIMEEHISSLLEEWSLLEEKKG